MGIRGRLLVLVIVAVVPLALLGLLGLRGEWLASREHLNQLVEQQAELAAVAFESWVNAQQQPLVALGASAEQISDRQELQRYLKFTLTPRPNWADIRLIDQSSKVIAVEPSDAAPLSSSLIEKLNKDLNDGRGPVIETAWTSPGTQAVIAIAAPMKNGGAVIARVNASALNELFGNMTLPQHAILTLNDEQNRVIYRSRLMDEYLGTDVSGSTLSTDADQRATTVIEVVSPIDGTQRIYGLAKAGTTRYTAIVGVPSVILYEPAWRKLTRYLLLSVLALAFTGVAALVIARSVTRPLRRLRERAHRFGGGDMSARASSGGGRELTELSETFNTMAAQIREREERLTELDRLKSEFVSGVSHELRTPLTTIKTLTRVMLRSGISDPTQRKYLETISAQCDRQIDLVLNLLDLSRIESGALNVEIGPVDTDDLIRSCIKIERPDAELHAHELYAELPSTLPTVAADRGALRRVVCSLIENAIKYTPDGGQIVVSACECDDHVEIRVTDTGRGVAQADLPHIFEKFYRGRAAADAATPAAQIFEETDPSGVGLGLYLANNLVKQMNGTISVEREPDRGSRFTIRLPVWGDSQKNMIEELERGETATLSR